MFPYSGLSSHVLHVWCVQLPPGTKRFQWSWLGTRWTWRARGRCRPAKARPWPRSGAALSWRRRPKAKPWWTSCSLRSFGRWTMPPSPTKTTPAAPPAIYNSHRGPPKAGLTLKKKAAFGSRETDALRNTHCDSMVCELTAACGTFQLCGAACWLTSMCEPPKHFRRRTAGEVEQWRQRQQQENHDPALCCSTVLLRFRSMTPFRFLRGKKTSG